MDTKLPHPVRSRNVPSGIRLLQCFPRPSWISKITAYRIYILVLTYLIYVAFHIIRKPFSVAKTILRPHNCSSLELLETNHTSLINQSLCSWNPFNKDSQHQFSWMDFSYRFSYGVGMVAAGHIGDRVDVRIFLTLVMMISSLWSIFLGLAYFWKIHMLSYFIVGQAFGASFQAAGFPCIMAVIGNWFGKKRRGLMFGIWNTDTSVGNILGALLAGVWVDGDGEWGYSFIVPGLLLAGAGLIAYWFIAVKPEDLGLPPSDQSGEDFTNSDTCGTELDRLPYNASNNINGELVEKKAIGLFAALMIPGVIEFGLCLFFSKAVYYTFFFWLPVYIKDSTNVGNQLAADISAVFDAGGIIGGILAGAASDAIDGRATVCGLMFIFGIPSLYCMDKYVGEGVSVLIALLIITGLFLQGPYTLITTAVATDLGTRPSLVKNTNALATVVGLIDGMGSLGSALGPLLAGYLTMYGWQSVFYFLILAQAVALLCLTRPIYHEVCNWIRKLQGRTLSISR